MIHLNHHYTIKKASCPYGTTIAGQTDLLGAYETRLAWDKGVLEMVEVLDGATVAFAGPQIRSAPGEVVFSYFNNMSANYVSMI